MHDSIDRVVTVPASNVKLCSDVSLAAMQYINNYYMSRQLEQEPEFISQCMDNLSATAKELHASSEESKLLCIQRALLLLKTHLETFKRR